MAAMFFDGTKIPTSVLCRIPHGIFTPSLVPIGQERNKIKNSKKKSKKGNNPKIV